MWVTGTARRWRGGRTQLRNRAYGLAARDGRHGRGGRWQVRMAGTARRWRDGRTGACYRQVTLQTRLRRQVRVRMASTAWRWRGGRMRPRNRAYGLATAARDGWHGRGGRVRVRVYSQTYGLATAARDERCDTRAVGRKSEHGRVGGRASKQSVSWAAAATAGRPPAAAGRPLTAGDQSVVYERENGDYILYKEKIRKEGRKAKLTVGCIKIRFIGGALARGSKTYPQENKSKSRLNLQ